MTSVLSKGLKPAEMVEAIKNLEAENTQLKTKIAALENQPVQNFAPLLKEIGYEEALKVLQIDSKQFTAAYKMQLDQGEVTGIRVQADLAKLGYSLLDAELWCL